MVKGILILGLLLGFQESAEERGVQTASLGRQEMPEKFPYQLLNEGFAVLKITLDNASTEQWTVKVEDLEVFSRKGKRIERARPTDITPKILKYYTGITGYDGHPEARTVREEIYREHRIGVRTGQAMVSLETVEGLRGTLEGYELKDATLAPGETVEAFYYLKSKETGKKLKGGWVILDGKRADF